MYNIINNKNTKFGLTLLINNREQPQSLSETFNLMLPEHLNQVYDYMYAEKINEFIYEKTKSELNIIQDNISVSSYTDGDNESFDATSTDD
jgi:hypothetical protein